MTLLVVVGLQKIKSYGSIAYDILFVMELLFNKARNLFLLTVSKS